VLSCGFERRGVFHANLRWPVRARFTGRPQRRDGHGSTVHLPRAAETVSGVS